MLPRKLVVEALGTFFLVLTIGQTVIGPNDAGNLAPLAIGSALMVMIYAGGHFSGGHFNPAVTLGVMLRGKCPVADAIPYMVAQVAGAALAAFTVFFLKGSGFKLPEAPPDAYQYSVGAKFLAEFLFTFALVWVVLNTATTKATEGNSNYGLAIGFTVLVGAFSVGAISGGAFNPAVAIGATIMGLIPSSAVWIHLAADFLGGAVAAILYKGLNMNQD